jgi:ATP-dependent helicase/nuclease subunit A
MLKERFRFTYPYKALSRLPAKLSVSRLSPGVLDVYDGESATPESIREEDAERLLHTFERAPLFGAENPEMLAAERGTATHEFLQFCSFERAERLGIKAELERLVEERYLAPKVRELVRTDELERFFKSEFYRMLQRANKLHRETRFHIFLPAADFTNDPALARELQGERLAVQGVIDLFFENETGELVLCDYKTDRLTREELADPKLATAKLLSRHGDQLSYYAKALESLCGRLPDRIFLYSLPFGEGLEVKL